MVIRVRRSPSAMAGCVPQHRLCLTHIHRQALLSRRPSRTVAVIRILCCPTQIQHHLCASVESGEVLGGQLRTAIRPAQMIGRFVFVEAGRQSFVVRITASLCAAGMVPFLTWFS
jgi:hypothetical protein